ncbi:MAG: transcriptional regulator [Cyanobacteria bacterium P01_E01_bin.42]
MTLTFNPKTYHDLLISVTPKEIATEEEYDRLLSAAEKLIFSKHRSTEQKELLKLLTILIEKYEAENYPMEESSPHEVLQYLMEASGTRQADLVGVIGSSGVVSEIVNGKRSISKAQAKALGDRFCVSPSLFI